MASKPTHTLCAKSDEDVIWHRVGVAWFDPKTQVISIALGPYTDAAKLNHTGARLRAFPIRTSDPSNTSASGTGSDALGDDDIPF